MRFDCGITTDDPVKVHILSRWRGPLEHHIALELAVLAHTPGIPIEWLYTVFGWGRKNRLKLRRMIDAADLSELGRENAATIEPGDGMRMLEAAMPYSGPAPLWSKLDLQNDRRSDAEIGRREGTIEVTQSLRSFALHL